MLVGLELGPCHGAGPDNHRNRSDIRKSFKAASSRYPLKDFTRKAGILAARCCMLTAERKDSTEDPFGVWSSDGGGCGGGRVG
ncbi:hypothetical protein KPH14_007336 [Odynerus spinipes]|uniref:Uncharacterized protein n=1 Tax=Odynerus spinipes TaxID=1348599 RepID=A0AAD9VJG4_9HYME|nr:hypothetical protein KPH14_007336 [Odynerus spinipes]